MVLRRFLSSVLEGTTWRIPGPGKLPEATDDDAAHSSRVKKAEFMALFHQDLSRAPRLHQKRSKTPDQVRR